ncbi:MAG: DUF4440 domain-containing protein [Terriglobia bacterium]
MHHRLSCLLLLGVLFLPVRAQQPPAPSPPPAFDARALADEVRDFYGRYWKAWDDRNVRALEEHLAPEFRALSFVDARGVVELNREQAVASLRAFFDAVRGQETLWSRNLLSVVPRSAQEAVTAVRNDFSLFEAGGEIELTIEVVRKGEDGQWRLVRKWSERQPFERRVAPAPSQ